MTASYRIINDGNHEGDTIRVYAPGDGSGHHDPENRRLIAELGLWEMSERMGATTHPSELFITGEHGSGESRGDARILVAPGAFTGLDFGQALALLKQGRRMARRGWNGKDMHVYLDEQTGAGRLPCIVMRTAQGMEQPGWLASQADMLAEDWFEIVADAVGYIS